MSKPHLAAEQENFITDLAGLLVPWGMQPSLASIYGYLLLQEEPATLDEIAGALGLAKSSVSTATRVLERYRLACRYGERGTKRVRYGASEIYSGFIVAQAHLMGEIGRLVQGRAAGVAEGETLQRLRFLGSFFRKMETSITGRVQELTDEFAEAGEPVDLDQPPPQEHNARDAVPCHGIEHEPQN